MSKTFNVSTLIMAMSTLLIIVAFEMHLRDMMPWAIIVGAIGAIGWFGTSLLCLAEAAKPPEKE